jgi:hypothetical protein
MSVLRFNMASKVFVLNNLIICVNSVPWVHYENYQRGSLAPIRYVARAAHQVSVTYLVG